LGGGVATTGLGNEWPLWRLFPIRARICKCVIAHFREVLSFGFAAGGERKVGRKIHKVSGFAEEKSRNAVPRRSLRKRIEVRIASAKSDAFLPREFSDLSGEDQVLRALHQLVREKRLVRLGCGVYGRAAVSRLSGEAILVSDGGFIGAARQALDKLKVGCRYPQ
jgi:hypothetical protein